MFLFLFQQQNNKKNVKLFLGCLISQLLNVSRKFVTKKKYTKTNKTNILKVYKIKFLQ